jgi:AraC-like DNA-binding protein
MPGKASIKVYDTPAFTTKFMPSEELNATLKAGFNRFFIVRVEDMYRHVHHAVPASRSTTHTGIYLTAGEAYMKIGSELYTIHKNEMLFVPAGQVFSFEAYDNTKFNKGYLFNFHDDILVGKFGKTSLLRDFEFLTAWGNPQISPDKQTSRFVLHLLKRLFLEYTENGLSNLNIIQPYFITLLCEVNRAYQPLSKSPYTHAVNLTNQFKQLLFTKIKTTHLVSDYAGLLHITPNHLNKAVRTITGKSPGKWIDEAIVLEAKVLLSQSTLSISEVAVEVGVEDQSYFTRLFKKQEGITPTTFRKMIEKS